MISKPLHRSVRSLGVAIVALLLIVGGAFAHGTVATSNLVTGPDPAVTTGADEATDQDRDEVDDATDTDTDANDANDSNEGDQAEAPEAPEVETPHAVQVKVHKHASPDQNAGEAQDNEADQDDDDQGENEDNGGEQEHDSGEHDGGGEQGD
jgi:hypothetical protein